MSENGQMTNNNFITSKEMHNTYTLHLAKAIRGRQREDATYMP